MIDEDIALSALAEAESKGSLILAEVRLEHRDMRHMTVKEGLFRSVITSRDAGMNVRIALPSGIGFASTNRMSKSEGSRLVQAAYRQAKNGAGGTPGRQTPA